MILQLIYLVLLMAAFGWYCTSGILFVWIQFQNPPKHRIADFLRTIRAELQPFYLPTVAVLLVLDTMSGEINDPWIALNNAARFVLWVLYRNLDDDDDRWKRRRAKVKEKIKRVGSRLVVVPAGTS